MDRSGLMRMLLVATVMALPLLLGTQWKSQIDYVKQSGGTLEVRVWGGAGGYQRFDLIENPVLPINYGYYELDSVYRTQVCGNSTDTMVVWDEFEYTESAKAELKLLGAEFNSESSYWLVGIRPVYQELEDGSETGLVVMDVVDVTDVLLRGKTYRHYSSLKQTTYILQYDYLIPFGIPLVLIILIWSAFTRRPIHNKGKESSK